MFTNKKKTVKMIPADLIQAGQQAQNTDVNAGAVNAVQRVHVPIEEVGLHVGALTAALDQFSESLPKQDVPHAVQANKYKETLAQIREFLLTNAYKQ